jgi:hypothetical protein
MVDLLADLDKQIAVLAALRFYVFSGGVGR